MMYFVYLILIILVLGRDFGREITESRMKRLEGSIMDTLDKMDGIYTSIIRKLGGEQGVQQ